MSDLPEPTIEEQAETIVNALVKLSQIAEGRREVLEYADMIVKEAVRDLANVRARARKARRASSRSLIRACEEARLAGIRQGDINDAVGMAGNSLGDVRRNVARWDREEGRV